MLRLGSMETVHKAAQRYHIDVLADELALGKGGDNNQGKGKGKSEGGVSKVSREVVGCRRELLELNQKLAAAKESMRKGGAHLCH